jgi:hypothetical protein
LVFPFRFAVLGVFTRIRPDHNLFFFRRSENLSTCNGTDEGDGDTNEDEDDRESHQRIAGSGLEALLLIELTLRLLNTSLASMLRLTWLNERLNPLIEGID